MTINLWQVGVLAAALLIQAQTALATCTSTSGPHIASLVELYTSEGCSSCPPADAQLKSLKAALDPGAEVVPLAMHVTYWDAIGWKDPYAQAQFGARHQWLVQANDHQTVVTPHFFVGGVESRHWPMDLRAEVRRQNALPAPAKVSLQGRLLRPGVLTLTAQAKLAAPRPNTAIYLALAEDQLVSSVARGENAGATLTHDHVVRAWLGPIALRQGVVEVQREVALAPSWVASRLTAVAFVQDQDTGHVLQAVSAADCAKP